MIRKVVQAILAGTVLGGVASVALSLTLEPEIDEWRMFQYGTFITLVGASTSTAIMAVSNRDNNNSKTDLSPNIPDPQLNFQDILIQTVNNGIQKHLDALQPGSSEYSQALELYGKVLLAQNDSLLTNTQKNKILHRTQGGDSR